MKKDLNVYKCPVDTVKIGCYDYEIRWMDDADFNTQEVHGRHQGNYNVLYVVPTINKWQMLNTLYHEIAHAICYMMSVREERPPAEDEKAQNYLTEEQYCSLTANGWIMVMRENTEFREWMNGLYRQNNAN